MRMWSSGSPILGNEQPPRGCGVLTPQTDIEPERRPLERWHKSMKGSFSVSMIVLESEIPMATSANRHTQEATYADAPSRLTSLGCL